MNTDVKINNAAHGARFRPASATRKAITAAMAATFCFSACGVAQAASGAATDQSGPVRADAAQVQPAMGGPYEAADSAEASAELRTDAQFRALFLSWKKLDSVAASLMKKL